MSKNTSRLVYFFAETHYFSQDHSILVVNIVGPFTKQNLSVFQECCQEVSKSRSKSIILNFRDVSPQIDSAFIPLLDELQKSIRGKAAQLRLSGLHPELKGMLKERSNTHPDEFANNLSEALQSLPPRGPNRENQEG